MSDYEILNRETFPRRRPEPGAPTVNFSISTGVVYFSKTSCDLMDLKAGDKVEILRQKDNPLHFGFRKTDSELGFKLRPKKAGQCFTAMPVVSRILTSMGSLATTTVQLGREPIEGAYWAILKSALRRL